MDTAPALLLLLTLGFCCPGIHGLQGEKRFMQYKTITYIQLGVQLDLRCHTSREDTDVVWVHQNNIETFKFIVFISALSGATFEGNQKASTYFEARKEDVFYHLGVKSFTLRDEGKYFCVMNLNQMLFFSPGQPAFLPATTVASSTPGHSTPGPSTQSGITEKDSCLNTPDPDSRMQEGLDNFCHIFLWVPTAGLCLLLLQLLAVTIVLRRLTAHHNPL